MPARLTVQFTDRPIRRFALNDGASYRVGRGEDCDLRIDDGRVSRSHARLDCAEGGWRVTDLRSKNGLAIDGRPVADGASLAGDCWVSLGGLLARFEVLSESERRAESERDLRRWHTTLELQRTLQPTDGLQGLLAKVLDSVLQLSGGERGFVLLARPDGELEVAATAGVETEELAATEFAGSVGAVEQALREKRPIVTCDALGDPHLEGRPSICEGGIRALVSLPLQALDRVIGAVYTDSQQLGSGFTELDVEILEALASHAALAIAVAQLSEESVGLAGEMPTRWEGSDPARRDSEDPLPWQPRRSSPGAEGRSWRRLVAAHAGR